ncbi:MAG: hypothetical protein A2Y25_04365 [Candidatus Melainabacteria bacterium GWF2_37_15]|nr:MAG: hypothetical protein A2Y25_04365 [Candidatus Melainabacteria bacterium GWF2_37_15]
MVYSRVADSCDCLQGFGNYRNINPDKARVMLMDIFGPEAGPDMIDRLEEECPEIFGNKNERYLDRRFKNISRHHQQAARREEATEALYTLMDYLNNKDEYNSDYYDEMQFSNIYDDSSAPVRIRADKFPKKYNPRSVDNEYIDSPAPIQIRADKHPKKHIHNERQVVDNTEFLNEALKGKSQDDIVSVDKETGVIKTKEAMGDNWEKQIIDANKETSTKTRNIDQGFLSRAGQFIKGSVKAFPPLALAFYGTEGYKDIADSVTDGYNYEHEYYEKGMKEPIKATGRTEQEAIENALKLREQYRLEKETQDFNF